MPDFDHESLVELYATTRKSVEDLYPSERRFLPWIASRSSSVLDVGCATGGFADVWRTLNADARYTGVDVLPSLIDVARRIQPDLEFLVGDCAAGLPLPDRAADAVQALGWMHWELRYADALAELWRIAGSFVFFDVRLQDVSAADIVGRQRIAEGAEAPYIVVHWPRLAALLHALRPGTVLGYGYHGQPTEGASGVPDELVFATFVLVRGDARAPTRVCLDLPFAWPEALPNVEVLPPELLEELAPLASRPAEGAS